MVIIYDYENNKVIDSINVVVGEKFEEQVHKSIEINSKRIRLDSGRELYGYKIATGDYHKLFFFSINFMVT
ncbi:hypothetical protein [Clostridium sp. CF012]|uniref:hypothetical protein n=1 Tax=Clostridium sp. CF012 TaxID=2843319 RepID=UPI001C0ADE6F|nr:hypothetical protein [Clostridium sp. CF012]MBU3145963.1 hypothetical protein [Clostridium sp. CF012]